jgi:hypothetical protein
MAIVTELFMILWRVYSTDHFWTPNLTCTGTGDAVRTVTSFIFYFTSRHYNYFLQCAVITSVLILYLGWSSDCWLLGCCSNLTPLIPSDVAPLIGSFDLLSICVSGRLLWSAALKLRLWAAPLISALTLRLWSVPLICFIRSALYCRNLPC